MTVLKMIGSLYLAALGIISVGVLLFIILFRILPAFRIQFDQFDLLMYSMLLSIVLHAAGFLIYWKIDT